MISEKFYDRMRELLGDDFDAFRAVSAKAKFYQTAEL